MIRPVEAEVNQRYGENPTSIIKPGSPDYWIIERFGNYQPDGHAGEDYAVEEGTPIRAVTSGTVVHVGYYGGSYLDNPYWIAPNFAGYCYVIDHGSFVGIYAHGKNKAARVGPGQYVDEGQIIGLSGNTGGSTGPHLHFEILPDGFVVNSYMYGRTNPETLFGGIAAMGTITPQTSQEDELSAEFERDVRAQLESDAGKFEALDRDLRAQLDGLPALDRDLRADLSAKGQQITALTATMEALAGMVGREQGLDVEQIKQAVTEAIAAGIKITVTVPGA